MNELRRGDGFESARHSGFPDLLLEIGNDPLLERFGLCPGGGAHPGGECLDAVGELRDVIEAEVFEGAGDRSGLPCVIPRNQCDGMNARRRGVQPEGARDQDGGEVAFRLLRQHLELGLLQFGGQGAHFRFDHRPLGAGGAIEKSGQLRGVDLLGVGERLERPEVFDRRVRRSLRSGSTQAGKGEDQTENGADHRD